MILINGDYCGFGLEIIKKTTLWILSIYLQELQ
jgi:hypothetical protein